MKLLHRKLHCASKKRKTMGCNGFSFREITDFENAIIEVHSFCRKKFEETNNLEYATVALDCLKAINDMEKMKSRTILKY
ncbi:MAG: hypothetical protein ACFFD2_11800 [Promethearchaeota archaeon]